MQAMPCLARARKLPERVSVLAIHYSGEAGLGPYGNQASCRMEVSTLTLDGKLVGVDDYEFSDYYEPLVGAMKKALSEKGIKGDLAVGRAGQDFNDQIGKSGSLHQFRSYAAYLSVHGEPPEEPDLSVIGHELNEMYEKRMPFGSFCHLINHSDSNGYYIPLDFAEPFTFDAPSFDGEGTWKCDLGSCQALLRELDEMNKYLKVPGDYGELCGSARLEQEIKGDVFQTEKWVWAVMRWLARESVQRNLLFEFC